MKRKVLKIFLTTILTSSFVMFFSNVIFAQSKPILTICEYSEEYKNWLKLSKEEQANTIMPNICKDVNQLATTREPYIEFNSNVFSFVSTPDEDASYDLRTLNGVTAVRNQESNYSCWAFASIASLESYLLLHENTSPYDFSEKHMDYATSKAFNNGKINEDGFDRDLHGGGNSFMAAAYLINNKGPIAESEMPHTVYCDLINCDLIDIAEIQNKTPLVDVNELTFFGNDYYNEDGCGPNITADIKKHLTTFGALSANINITDDSNYYNEVTAALYNNQEFANHSIAIVGWDDNFALTNFASNNKPSRNGAWIVKNSYGEEYGDKGYLYVSYDDSTICNSLMGIMNTDLDIEDNMYYYDPLGYNLAFGIENQDSIYAANIFKTKTDEEQLKEITVGIPFSGAVNLKFYVNAKVRETSEETNEEYLNSSNIALVAEQTVDHAGYYTIKLTEPITLTEDEFAIIVKYTYSTDIAYIPISSNISSTDSFIAQPGNGYYSADMITWQDIYNLEGQSDDTNNAISIKVATNSTGYKFNLKSTTYSENNYFVSNINAGTSYESFLNTLADTDYSSLEIYNQQDVKVTSGNIGTGMIMKVSSGGVNHNYSLVVKGDTTGDGNIGSNDALVIRRHVVGLNSLSKVYQLAGDVDGSSSLSSLDALKIRRYVVGLGSL